MPPPFALDDDLVRQLVESVEFADPAAAARAGSDLALLAASKPQLAAIWPRLLASLTSAASPDRALVNFVRFVQGDAAPPELPGRLEADPRLTEMLVTLFAGSQFLTEILLRHPDYLDFVSERAALSQIRSARQFEAAGRQAMEMPVTPSGSARDSEAAFDALRRYQRAELLRIGIGDLCALLDLPSVTQQLSHLAEGIVAASLAHVSQRMGIDDCGFVVLAMGKLGGCELNYSSDIDLLFLAAEDAASYERLGERLIAGLTAVTGEGFLYRVDMRLRPWGAVGPLVSTVDGYLNYLRQSARLWEKQALVRARPIAGNLGVGQAFLDRAIDLIFALNRETARTDVHAMKQRTEARLRELGQAWGEVKLGEGSIRDVEFVVQFLQLTHGADHIDLRGGTILDVLSRLAEQRLVTPDDHRVLAEGYVFLRTVEHYLQILDYRQTHLLPAHSADLRYLARRLGYSGPQAAARFVTRYQQHSAAVRAVYWRHLAAPQELPGGVAMTTTVGQPSESTGPRNSHADGAGQTAPGAALSDAAGAQLRQHLARMSSSYADAFTELEIRRHADLASRLSDGNPVEVRAEALGDGLWRVTIVAYDYLGELSAIGGLLFAHGYNIIDGQVFTYEPETNGARPDARAEKPAASQTQLSGARKIVDVFTVRSTRPGATDDDKGQWLSYAANLAALLRMLHSRRHQEAQGELVKRIAVALPAGQPGPAGVAPTLQPVDIEIDNAASERYTILRIDAPDTPGFLFEFTNALSLNGIHIAQVSVDSIGSRVHDVLHVTDLHGRKITDPDRQRELRAATVLVKHFTHLLPHSPNPEAALQHFNEYLGELFRRPSWPDELASLERPEVLSALARLLGVSEFLWDDFLRMQYANLFPVVEDVSALSKAKTKAQLTAELSEILAGAGDGAARRERLNAFKDREMFRIDMRHILGHVSEFGQFSAELTELAETIVAGATELVVSELQPIFGRPVTDSGAPVALAVCVLGKSGGCELGYASDIEVMFVYAGPGQTTGPRIVSAAEYYDRLVTEFNRSIWARREGIFQIDLDLRPYGSAGSLAVSLDSFRRYFASGGPAWSYERQALIKLRAIAGDEALGREIESLRDAIVYSGSAFDSASMRAMRERQLRHLVTPGTINAKFSPGALVDLEYTVQGLQMMHGRERPALRLTNTRAAIAALAENGVLSTENAARLGEALLFLRQLINALRMVRGNSKDLTVPPEESDEFAYLARRLNYGNEPGRLRADLTHHLEWVRRLNARLLG